MRFYLGFAALWLVACDLSYDESLFTRNDAFIDSDGDGLVNADDDDPYDPCIPNAAAGCEDRQGSPFGTGRQVTGSFAQDGAAASNLILTQPGKLPTQMDGERFVLGELATAGNPIFARFTPSGEGIPTAAAHFSVLIKEGAPKTNVFELANPFLSPPTRAASVTIDAPIALLPTRTISGVALIGGVPASDLGTHARVVVYRNLKVQDRAPENGQAADDPTLFTTYLGPIEAEATADQNGNFVLRGVAQGQVQIAVAVFDGEATIGALRQVSAAVVVDVADVDIALASPIAVPSLADALPTRGVSLVMHSNTGDAAPPADIVLQPMQEGVILCGSGTNEHRFDSAGTSVSIDVGYYFLELCDVERGSPADLRDSYFVARAADITDAVPFLGPFVSENETFEPRIGDLDGDGAPALPVLATGGPDVVVWSACETACGNAHGSVNTRCEVDTDEGRIRFDCDDDGDGQSDITEPFSCIGTILGGDADADGLCDKEDPFPWCEQNSAALCPAVDGAFTPAVRPELLVD